MMHAEERLLDLVGAMEDLKAMRNRVLREIELQEEKGKQRTQKVQAWLDKVVDMDQCTNQLVIDFSRCCVTGCCSLNIYSRLNVSRKATKLKKEIDGLMNEKNNLSVLAKKRPSKPIIDMPISTTNVGIMTGSNLRVIRDYLGDKTFGIIGIYGMGGIGKTTLLKEIERSIYDWNMGFDYVIHAKASYELHVEDLRDCIAEQLSLCGPSRETIFKFLKYKNFLLLLDDLWEELDITVLGIPDPHDESYVTTLYKHTVVFTTRSNKVCDCMKANKKIKLECLDKDEGWQLFKENLAMDLEGKPFIEEAAREVANLCGGLPLALVMVGQAMSNKTSTTEWNFILDQLWSGLCSSLCESMFLYLRSSYDSLANKILQQCFLCFCLWPKKKLISTEDLIKCWLEFGLISCFDSLSEAYMHGCYILEILEEASLVVTHDNKRVAKVHEVIHEMAQWIASRAGGGSHKPWFVRQNITSEQLSSEEVEAWFQLERVSIVNCNLNCLPELQFECPSLLSLNIQHNRGLKNLPKIFFQQMSNLAYLNLSFTGIHEFPASIMDLCNLEFLDISCTRINSLPNKLGNLKKLKYLFCGYLFLGELQVELLSSLHSLQVLDVYPYGYVESNALFILRQRGVKGIGMCVSSNYILEQLSNLPIVNINIKYINGLSTLHFSSLTSEEHGGPKELQISFSVAIQNLVINNKSKTSLKLLRLYQLQNLRSFVWTIEPKEVFPMLQIVQIEACFSLTSLHWVFHLPLLHALLLQDCYKMKELVNEEEREIKEDDVITTFPKLKYLKIVRLPKLVEISSCAIDFPHLSKVHLEDCPNLKRLPFKPDIVSNQGLLIKCERKWWERLEWDDANVHSQFCSNSTEDEEIAEFFVGNVPAFGHKDLPRKFGRHEVLRDYVPLWGSVSICGRRPQMEDAVMTVPRFFHIPITMLPADLVVDGIIPDLISLSGHFFGVYDGHGGSQVANYCRERLHLALVEELTIVGTSTGDDWQKQWEKAFINCFLKVDDEVCGEISRGTTGSTSDAFEEFSISMGFDSFGMSEPVAPENVGSTALVAVICSSHIIIANCGDSRAVLCRGEQPVALSNDHKPNREDEYARIEAEGGEVVIHSDRYCVCGVLPVSRSIGDRYLKPFIIPDPEITVVQRTSEDEYLILASDGLWDVMSNEEVCDAARRRILLWHKKSAGTTATPSLIQKGEEADSAAQAAADYLSNLAMEKGSMDNITVIVVDLKAGMRKLVSSWT
ncbi:disease resistance protein RPS2-like isoform X2 [Dioscorea cayenensis subsp. rotundata]|uniref:protein-serine/threonine phosphatase n=1 Tax=Dioscorea cayennensis subsp. rotundata TaxID=55577 RepID=A0AB40APG7_DIOCR|nr:disease resistance protein RPS2-like isoform X2 [Dioscorea cayenensis subsp. rotundata]